ARDQPLDEVSRRRIEADIAEPHWLEPRPAAVGSVRLAVGGCLPLLLLRPLLIVLVARIDRHAAALPLAVSAQSPTGGVTMRVSRPAAGQRRVTLAAASWPAGSASAAIVRASMPASTGNSPRLPAPPSAQTGRSSRMWRAIAVSTPSAVTRP